MKTYSRRNSSYLRKAFVGSNFDEMCRLCLSEVDMRLKPIFQELSKISYQEWIQYSVDVLVEEGDGLPPNICEECLLMVEQIYLFKKKCKASDTKLREHLELLELDEEGKYNEMGLNNFTEDKDVFSKENKEDQNETNCDESNAIDSGGTEPPTKPPEENQQEQIDSPIPEPKEETPQEKVQIKRYILKGEIREDNQEEDLTVCEVIPLEDKNPTADCEVIPLEDRTPATDCENGLNEISQDNRIQEIYKLWDNEEETEQEHMSVEDYEEIGVDIEGDKSVKKNGVIKVYTNEKQMVIMEAIPETHKCYTCQKVFVKSSELALHLAKFHQNSSNSVVCKTCGKSFTCPNSLKRHMAIHTGVRPYQCHVCNRKFSQGSILKRHELTHNALKPFNCEICGKSYTQKMNLLTHLKNHGFGTVQDRFRCTICSKSFVHQSGLSRHTKMHQGVRYLCVKCKRSFADSSALSRHMKTTHPAPG